MVLKPFCSQVMSEKVQEPEQVNCGTVVCNVSDSRVHLSISWDFQQYFSHILIPSVLAGLFCPTLEAAVAASTQGVIQVARSCQALGHTPWQHVRKEYLPVHSAGCQKMSWSPKKCQNLVTAQQIVLFFLSKGGRQRIPLLVGKVKDVGCRVSSIFSSSFSAHFQRMAFLWKAKSSYS